MRVEGRSGPFSLLLSPLLSYSCIAHLDHNISIMKHRLLREWLCKVLVIICIIEMVPTKGVMTPGTFTNFFDYTTEGTNFNMDFQAVGYSPFTTTKLDGMIVWTMSVIPAVCSMNQNKMLGMEKALEKVVTQGKYLLNSSSQCCT